MTSTSSMRRASRSSLKICSMTSGVPSSQERRSTFLLSASTAICPRRPRSFSNKVSETRVVTTAEYFRAAEARTDVRCAVIATDDHRAVQEARDQFPEWTVHTLCDQTAQGHDQRLCDSQARSKIYDDVVTLLADAELLFSARSAFVTYTANMGMFLGMRRGHAERPAIHSLDGPQWQIW
ncbi:MAG: hypothetical protein JWN99_2161 [Ilumatobacteraceae bacterium]|nr:hypothetical protein [Ilumatobacteraceae bacterium]